MISVIEEISKMSNGDCDDDVLMNILECEFNGDEHEEPKKHNYKFCIDCNKEVLIDNQNSILVCTNCGLCEYYPVYVRSYNHTMKPLKGNSTQNIS